jgi:hypothetical protein
LKQRFATGCPIGVLLSFDFWPGHLEMFKAEERDLREAMLTRPASVYHPVKRLLEIGAPA